MKSWLKYLWIGLAVLLLLYAFDALILGMIKPVFTPLNTYADKIVATVISIALAAGILAYINYTQYEKE